MKYHVYNAAGGRWQDKLLSFPKTVMLLVLGLCLVGLLLLYSAGYNSEEDWLVRQGLTVIGMMLVFVPLSMVNITFWHRHAYNIYYLALFLLLVAEVLGHEAMGAQRWIRVAGFNLQPVEFIKIGLILALSRYYHKLHHGEGFSLKVMLPPLVMVALPTLLVLKQPNLGSAVILISISGSIMFAAGVQVRNFVAVLALGALSLPIIWRYLHDYQKQRVLTFLYPEADPLGSGYNIIQSKIAIGSGGLTGKGLFEGSQAHLDFLPEKQTDFIFTILAEEYGFLGCMILLVMYGTLIAYSYQRAWGMQHQFGRLLICGVNSMLFIHVLVNLSMISGLIPVVGTPLPFLSYGRSNLVAMIGGYALVANACVYQKRNMPRSQGA
ncbi:MAG: rod shape-determining protein RodA [Proteobacteria bacterium]|nr:rod shape-determining protein RodA [Pseudomonadota bacterium]